MIAIIQRGDDCRGHCKVFRLRPDLIEASADELFSGNIRWPASVVEAPGIHLSLDLPRPRDGVRLRRKFPNGLVTLAAVLRPPGVPDFKYRSHLLRQ
jgi:hypothetical protein